MATIFLLPPCNAFSSHTHCQLGCQRSWRVPSHYPIAIPPKMAAWGHHGFVARDVGVPDGTHPLKEVGLAVLAPLLNATVGTSPSRRNTTALRMIGASLNGVPPLKMFEEVTPPRSPPELPILLSAHQVAADSQKSGSQYGVYTAFAPASPNSPVLRPPTSPSKAALAAPGWRSRTRPGKSTVTTILSAPTRLSSASLELPGCLLPAFIGMEVLPAPRVGMSKYEVIACLASASSASRWERVGVVAPSPQSDGGGYQRRFSIAAPPVIAFRLSFKGYHPDNTEQTHALTRCVLYAVDASVWTAMPAVGGGQGAVAAAAAAVSRIPLHTDALSVLHTLEGWAARSASVALCGTTLEQSQGMDGDATYASRSSSAFPPSSEATAAFDASLDVLCGLALATGALSCTLTLIGALLDHPAALSAPSVARIASFLAALDRQVDVVGWRCSRVARGLDVSSGLTLNSSSLTSPATAARDVSGGSSSSDRTATTRFEEVSSGILFEGEGGKKVKSRSSPEYAALNVGISRGRIIVDFKLDHDTREEE